MRDIELLRRRAAAARQAQGQLPTLERELKKYDALCIERRREYDKLCNELEKAEAHARKAGRGVFDRLLGRGEEEQIEAAYKLSACKKECETARMQLDEFVRHHDSLREQVQKLQDQAQHYEETLDTLARAVEETDPETAVLRARIHESVHETRELEEAMDAARKARHLLDEMRAALDSAANWGVYDMIGGGAFSSAIKHSKIDEADAKAAALRQALSRLSRELQDVAINENFSVDVTGCDRMLDIWLDNLFTDWHVQDQIEKARTTAGEIDRALTAVWGQVESRQAANQAKLHELRTQLADHLLANMPNEA